MPASATTEEVVAELRAALVVHVRFAREARRRYAWGGLGAGACAQSAGQARRVFSAGSGSAEFAVSAGHGVCCARRAGGFAGRYALGFLRYERFLARAVSFCRRSRARTCSTSIIIWAIRGSARLNYILETEASTGTCVLRILKAMDVADYAGDCDVHSYDDHDGYGRVHAHEHDGRGVADVGGDDGARARISRSSPKRSLRTSGLRRRSLLGDGARACAARRRRAVLLDRR